jgi:hypothetical protein
MDQRHSTSARALIRLRESPDMTAAEVSASYQVMRLVKEHPRISNLLFKVQDEGADWITLLKILQQALAEKAG